MNTNTKPTSLYWIIAAVSLIWNLMGCFSYISQRFITPEMMEAMSEAKQQMFLNTPVSVNQFVPPTVTTTNNNKKFENSEASLYLPVAIFLVFKL